VPYIGAQKHNIVNAVCSQTGTVSESSWTLQSKQIILEAAFTVIHLTKQNKKSTRNIHHSNVYHVKTSWQLMRWSPTPAAVCVRRPYSWHCYRRLRCLNRSRQLQMHHEILSSYTVDMYASFLSATGQYTFDEMLKTKTRDRILMKFTVWMIHNEKVALATYCNN